MGSVEAERAALEKDLEEVRSELWQVRERLSDDGFLSKAKPELIAQQQTLQRQLIEREGHIEANLKRVEERSAGGLPSSQAGTWSPLFLHERAPVEEEVDDPPLPAQRVEPLKDNPHSIDWVAHVIGRIVTSGKTRKRAVRDLRNCIEPAGDHVPTLTLIAAALEGLNADDQAADLLHRVAKLTGKPTSQRPIESAPEIPALSPMPLAELLPDPRDGLTRMQRIVLSAMYALLFRADGQFKKTSMLVDEIRNSDWAITAEQIEATLTQLTHPWSARNPLIEVSGSQCRLRRLAEELFFALEGEGDDLEPGFTFKLARVLPAPFPLLLAKGTDGVPPHHLTELVTAALHLLQFPRASLSDLLAIVRGPEFPRGGDLAGTPRALYGEGRGVVTVRAKVDLQMDSKTRSARFVISELPWPLERSEVKRRLEALRHEGIASISDGENDCIIVQLEHVAHARGLAAHLAMSPALAHSVAVEIRVNEFGSAIVCDLRRSLEHFLTHRRVVTMRRHERELSEKQRRAEALEALLVTTELLAPVLDVVGDGVNAPEQRWGLMNLATPQLTSQVSFATHTPIGALTLKALATKLIERLRVDEPRHPGAPSHSYELGFSRVQACAILATRRLGSLSREALFREWAGVAREMADLAAPLNDASALDAIIQTELAEVRERYASPRRTKIGGGA